MIVSTHIPPSSQFRRRDETTDMKMRESWSDTVLPTYSMYVAHVKSRYLPASLPTYLARRRSNLLVDCREKTITSEISMLGTLHF